MGWRYASGLAGQSPTQRAEGGVSSGWLEKRGRAITGRARMALIPDFGSETLLAFLKDNVAPGSTVYTDGLKSFTGLKEAGPACTS